MENKTMKIYLLDKLKVFIKTISKSEDIPISEFAIKNLDDLSIKYIDSDYLKNTRDASYDFVNNEVKISKKGIENDSIYHELFHVITRNVKPNKIICGFSTHSTNNDIDYGIGLNEGFTEFLCGKYFDKASAYGVERFYIEHLVNIIGYDNMLKAYLNAEPNKLFDYLSEYVTESEFENFICNLDDFTTGNKEKKLQKAVTECSNFILNCYSKTLTDSNKDNYYQLLSCMENLNQTVTFNDGTELNLKASDSSTVKAFSNIDLKLKRKQIKMLNHKIK